MFGKFIVPLVMSLGLLIATIVAVTPAPAVGAGFAMSQVQMPCREAGHREQACVVVHKLLSGREAIDHQTFSLTPAAMLKGKTQNFSVIYVYHTNPSVAGGTATVSVERGDDGYMTDVHVGKPGQFWMTTRDGGRTWSKISSNIAGGLSM